MDARLTLITLGVRDVDVSAAFYGRLGWSRSSAGGAGVAFFQLGPIVLGLFGARDLRQDAHLPDTAVSGPGAMSLAQNVGSPAAVDAALSDAVAAGATLMTPGQQVFWGGYSGYFADPDGHLWEIAYNPLFPLDASGQIRLSD